MHIFVVFQTLLQCLTMTTPIFSKKVIEIFDQEVIRYQDHNENICLDIIPEKAQIVDIKLQGTSILCGPSNKEELLENSSYKGAFLVPFPNRLKNGKFTFQGKEYQFPVNDKSNQHALHGFKRVGPFKVVTEEAGSSLFLSLQHSYDGHLDYFPFPFLFSVDIRVDKFKLEVAIQILNTGLSEAPFGFGWHPYFTLHRSIDECSFCIPTCKKIELDECMIPSGKTTPFKDFSKSKKIESACFDTPFLLSGDADFTSVVLEDERYKLRYYQETRPSKFNYLQIYTPEDRQSIAFEPMTCNVNALNNQEGLHILAPGKKFRARCGVELKTK